MGLFGMLNKKNLSEVYPECKKLYIQGKLEKAENLLLPFAGQHPDADYLLAQIQMEIAMRKHDKKLLANAKDLLIGAASKGHKESAQRLADLFNDRRFLPQEAPKPAAPAPEPEEDIPGYDLYESGCELYEEEDYESALELFLEAAEMGCADAAYNVAIMYMNEEGTECDPDEALYWAKVAAKGGVEGADELAEEIQAAIEAAEEELAEEDEDSPDADDSQLSAVELFDKAVAHHSNGNYEEAASLFAQAAYKGNGQAAVNLAVMFVQGKGVDRNLYEASLWAHKATNLGARRGRELLEKIDQYIAQEEAEAAAEKAKPTLTKEERLRREFFEDYNPVDQFDAMVHAHRMGDKATAKAIMNELAAKGDTYAAKYASVCNDPQAYHDWLNNAFLEGHPMSLVAMGIEYIYGETGKQELGYAAIRVHEAEDLGHPYTEKLRQLVGTIGGKEPLALGREAYRQGNFQQAYKHYMDANNLCSDDGTYLLARMLMEGTGIKKNTVQGLEYLRQLANRNYEFALSDLAKVYFTGNGDLLQYNRARYWADKAGSGKLEQAIDQVEYGLDEFRNGDYEEAMLDMESHVDSGNMDAAYRVGAMYRDGLDTDKDILSANLAFERLQSERGITFGSFVNPKNNRVRPLTWHILELDKKNRRMLLFCDYVLEQRAFSNSANDSWNTSSLRKWLNGDALNKYFTPWEQKQILSYDHNRAADKLWLPDKAMIDKYFSPADWDLTNKDGVAIATLLYKHAQATGTWFPDKAEGKDEWWVDIPGKYGSGYCQYVDVSGQLVLVGYKCTDSKAGPRPMMWIKY